MYVLVSRTTYGKTLIWDSPYAVDLATSLHLFQSAIRYRQARRR
jgi:hypothetical protein